MVVTSYVSLRIFCAQRRVQAYRNAERTARGSNITWFLYHRQKKGVVRLCMTGPPSHDNKPAASSRQRQQQQSIWHGIYTPPLPFWGAARVESVVDYGLQALVQVLGLLELHHHRQEGPGALVRELLPEQEPVGNPGSLRKKLSKNVLM